MNYLLSIKRTWTVRFDNRNRIACFVRTHFFRKGISGFSPPGNNSVELRKKKIKKKGMKINENK